MPCARNGTEKKYEIDGPFEAHKFAIDVHERAGKRFRQIIYRNNVSGIVSIYQSIAVLFLLIGDTKIIQLNSKLQLKIR